jgi:hypothetical protein
VVLAWVKTVAAAVVYVESVRVTVFHVVTSFLGVRFRWTDNVITLGVIVGISLVSK